MYWNGDDYFVVLRGAGDDSLRFGLGEIVLVSWKSCVFLYVCFLRLLRGEFSDGKLNECKRAKITRACRN